MSMKTISRASTSDMALLILVAIIWASAFMAIKIAVPEVGPIWLAAIRVAIGVVALAPYALAKGVVLPSTTRIWALVVIMAVLNVVIPFFLISWAELTIDAGVTSLLMGIGPFLALIGSHVFTNDDKINGRKALGVACGFTGVVTIVGWDALTQIGNDHLLAQFAAIGGCFCYVVAGILIRRIDIPPLSLAFLALMIGTIILLPIALATDGMLTSLPSSTTLMALIYLGVFPTGIAYILRFYLINKVGYSAFAMSVNLIPVFGILMGVVLLGEPLRPQVILALILVLLGLYFMRSGGGPKNLPAPVRPAE